MSKHTPGPWEISEYQNDHTRWLEIWPSSKDNGATVIASLTIENRFGASFYDTPGNALLIAAAPDLLEAAEDILYRVEVGADVTLRDDIAALRAAIARAKGEA